MADIIRFPRKWHPKRDLTAEVVQLLQNVPPSPPRPPVRPRSNNTYFACARCGGDHLTKDCKV